MSDVQIKSGSDDVKGIEFNKQFEAPKTEIKKYDLTPGRVLLVNAGSSDAEEISRRTNIEQQYGLRLISFDEVLRNRLDTESGNSSERLSTSIEVGEGQLG